MAISSTDVANLEARYAEVCAELAAMTDVKKGGKPDAGGGGVMLVNPPYGERLGLSPVFEGDCRRLFFRRVTDALGEHHLFMRGELQGFPQGFLVHQAAHDGREPFRRAKEINILADEAGVRRGVNV